jgi:hypothetical protein
MERGTLESASQECQGMTALDKGLLSKHIKDYHDSKTAKPKII